MPQWLLILLPGSRINKDDISAEFQKEVKRVQVAKVEAEKQENLKALMDDFLKVLGPRDHGPGTTGVSRS